MPKSKAITLEPQVIKKFTQQLTQELNLNKNQAQKLVDQGLPTLIESLAQKTNNKPKLSALALALKNQKHDGRILKNNQAFFADHHLDDGDKILKHLLGNTRNNIVAALAAETKTTSSQAQKALSALSPVVMGAVGAIVQSQKLNAQELENLLKIAVTERNFGKLAKRVALLLLDKNGNQQYKDDLFEIGRRWLGRFLNLQKKK